MKIGIISDTHITNPQNCNVPEWVINAFRQTDMIVHAGDIERPEFIQALADIAPVYAVRGNCDHYGFDTPAFISIETGFGHVTVAHKAEVARRNITHQTRVMVYGHTHISLINHEADGLLVINPGSMSLPRGGLPASVAILTIDNEQLYAELIKKS